MDSKRVLVTGGASGIGAAAVRGFVNSGAQVAAVYRKTRPKDSPDNVTWFACDLTQKIAVGELFEQVQRSLGGLDVLVHAAGTWRPAEAESASQDEIDFLLEVNLKATIFVNQSACGLMRDDGGRIINFGSVEGVRGNAHSPIYALSKAAIHSWTRSAASAWGGYNITVNAIAPIMQTPLMDYATGLLSEEERAIVAQTFKAQMPIDGKPGFPLRDCVPLLIFLAGEGGRFITGQLISVDGGAMMLGA